VDESPVFQDECNSLPYGGHLSVHKGVGEKPMIMLGQDECIFKQFNLTNKSWSDPEGTRALLPKDDGQGVMISAFVSREFGFGMKLTSSQLDEINRERSKEENKYYSDKDAAFVRNGSEIKPKLTSSPFVHQFEYGNNLDGYWTYDCMILQLEDCIDCLKVLYPSFQFCFLFDHSNGHDQMQPNGLNARRVNKNFRGKQPIMCDSVITDPSCFGEYHDNTYNLQLNDSQKMNFTADDTGPFYLNETERLAQKYDTDTGKVCKRPILKERLVEMLKEMKMINPKGNMKKIQQQCVALDLPVECTEKIIREGWVGKPKGAFQILYKRGWINPSKPRDYTEKGKMDEMGNIIENSSINLLMMKQTDFASELTLLQYHGNRLGVIIDCTPKCHPELAGEGIEYIWALAKLYYRHKPLSQKRSKDSFRGLVNYCLSQNKLDVRSVQKSARRACEYMMLYKSYTAVVQDEESASGWNHNGCNKKVVHFNYEMIEKAIKTYKSHRNAKDFDVKFVSDLKLDSVKSEFLKKVVTKMRSSF
jgi:hypothetical protein